MTTRGLTGALRCCKKVSHYVRYRYVQVGQSITGCECPCAKVVCLISGRRCARRRRKQSRTKKKRQRSRWISYRALRSILPRQLEGLRKKMGKCGEREIASFPLLSPLGSSSCFPLNLRDSPSVSVHCAQIHVDPSSLQGPLLLLLALGPEQATWQLTNDMLLRNPSSSSFIHRESSRR